MSWGILPWKGFGRQNDRCDRVFVLSEPLSRPGAVAIGPPTMSYGELSECRAVHLSHGTVCALFPTLRPINALVVEALLSHKRSPDLRSSYLVPSVLPTLGLSNRRLSKRVRARDMQMGARFDLRARKTAGAWWLIISRALFDLKRAIGADRFPGTSLSPISSHLCRLYWVLMRLCGVRAAR